MSKRAITAQQRAWLLEQLSVLSEYSGPGIPDGVRSVAWRLTYRDPERTLQAKEIAGRRDRLLRTLEGDLGVRQRMGE